jgi:hypothetical protein
MNVDTMLKDPQTPRYAQRRTHRTYTPQFKAELVVMCQKPGASIAAVALRGDLNFGAESRVSSRGLTRIRSNLLEPTRTIP